MTEDNKLRLQKWISQQGLASRREAEDWIRAGKVRVNKKLVTELGTKIDPKVDHVSIEGKKLAKVAPPKVYWLFHKPDKTLTARPKKTEPKQTIYDVPALKQLKFFISAVGRLDYRTEGLLLLTNDGELANKLCRPEYHVPRHYLAFVDKKLSAQQLDKIRKGFTLTDGPVKNIQIRFAESKKIANKKTYCYYVTVQEGRNRIIRRIFEEFEASTIRLIRYGFDELRLPEDLAPGEYIQLTKLEIRNLKRATQHEISDT